MVRLASNGYAVSASLRRGDARRYVRRLSQQGEDRVLEWVRFHDRNDA
jgi:hypothetical protein